MSTQLKTTEPSHKPLFAGIDVGAEELILVIRNHGVPRKAQTCANTVVDRARLAKKLSKLPGIIVCMEATGIYHLDLSIALHDAGVRLMVANPKASHNFAKVLMKTARQMRWMPARWQNMPSAWTLWRGHARPTNG